MVSPHPKPLSQGERGLPDFPLSLWERGTEGVRACLAAPLLAALLLAACAQQPPQPQAETPAEPRPPVEVEASIDRAVATTGDVLTYIVTVNYDPAYTIDAPETGAEIAGFRIIDTRREEPRTVGDRTVEERWYKLRADLVGSYVLPAITVRYTPGEGQEGEAGEVKTSEIFVEVESVLPAEGEEAVTDIRGLKELRPIEEPTPWWWWAVGGGALLALLGLVIWRVRRGRKARPAAPPLPPHEIAFRALDALRGTDFEDPEAVRRFHFAISEVLRAYVEGRCGLNATDLTTEEILQEIPHLTLLPDAVLGPSTGEPTAPPRPRHLSPDEAERLRRFLDATDRVKFAAHEPTEEAVQGVYEDALGFVEATRPQATTTTPASTATATATTTGSPDPDQEAAA
jgi:hypothetical protein